MKNLQVFWNRRKVGQFTDQERLISFQYSAEWLATGGMAISASLPLQAQVLTTPSVARFIGNLLPEGQPRESLLNQFKLDSTDDFGLLERLGAECAGALTILPESEQPLADDAPFDVLYSEAMDAYERGQFIQAFAASPAHAFKGQRPRLSLAGVQRKFAIARFDGALYRTRHGASTHIVKPDIPEVLGLPVQVPGIVFNEYFCGRLASQCGLQAAAVELLPFTVYRDGPPQYAFMSERFDRQAIGHGRVLRLHQEDFCQALGMDRRRKYEEDGEGVSLTGLFAFVRNPSNVRVPVLAQQALLKGLVFNVLIGNGGAHAKNYGLLRLESGVELAPLYDLVSTQIYDAFNNDFAQKIGNARRFADLTAEALRLLAESIGIKPRTVIGVFADLANRMPTSARTLRAQMAVQPYWGEARATVDRAIEIISTRCTHMKRLIAGAAHGSIAWEDRLLESARDAVPDKAGAERLLALLADNGGRLSMKDRDNEFPGITDAAIQNVEAQFTRHGSPGESESAAKNV